MSRVNKGNRAHRKELESAALELVVVESDLPVVALRIEQAIKRAGLQDLLLPALNAVTRSMECVRVAKKMVESTASELDERGV